MSRELRHRIEQVKSVGIPVRIESGRFLLHGEVIGYFGEFPEIAVRGGDWSYYLKKIGSAARIPYEESENITPARKAELYLSYCKSCNGVPNRGSFDWGNLELHQIYDKEANLTYHFVLPARNIVLADRG